MVKAIIENSSAAAGISELMVQKGIRIRHIAIDSSHRYFRFILAISNLCALF
ncbi:MAG UNVERIFIED_CONTAM: hypothetical protein LVR29_20985 [Microcystis novacekii LVE1205-3]